MYSPFSAEGIVHYRLQHMKTFEGLTLSFFKLNFSFLQFPMKTIPQVQSHDCQEKNKLIK